MCLEIGDPHFMVLRNFKSEKFKGIVGTPYFPSAYRIFPVCNLCKAQCQFKACFTLCQGLFGHRSPGDILNNREPVFFILDIDVFR